MVNSDPMHLMTIEMGAWCGASGPRFNGRASSAWREVTCADCHARRTAWLLALAWDMLQAMPPSHAALDFAVRAGRLGVTDEQGRPLAMACAPEDTPVNAATPGQAAPDAWEALLTVLDGMVPLAALEVARWSPHRRGQEAQRLADIIGAADALIGDAAAPSRHDMETMPPPHLWAGEGQHRAYRPGEILSALARGIAIGRDQPGGVTFAGRHWCAASHEGCPLAVPA